MKIENKNRIILLLMFVVLILLFFLTWFDWTGMRSIDGLIVISTNTISSIIIFPTILLCILLHGKYKPVFLTIGLLSLFALISKEIYLFFEFYRVVPATYGFYIGFSYLIIYTIVYIKLLTKKESNK